MTKKNFSRFNTSKGENFMLKIERINGALRDMTRLNKEDVKGMHLVSDACINLPEPMRRYNIRTKNGTIQKYTLGDDFVSVSYIRKIGNRYVENLKRFIGRKSF